MLLIIIWKYRKLEIVIQPYLCGAPFIRDSMQLFRPRYITIEIIIEG
jgi:hypothetical protein